MREFRELPTREEKEQRVELLGGLVDFLREKWELEMPSVIFSVTGSAQELTLRPKFREPPRYCWHRGCILILPRVPAISLRTGTATTAAA